MSLQEVRTPLSHLNSFSDYDTLSEVREATDSPTPLSELLHDPVALKSLIGHKKVRRPSEAGSSRERSEKSREGRRRDKDREKDSDTTSILTLVLAEEERQAHHLKAILRNTGERLESEMRRAESAEKRAYTAESQARDVMTRLSRAEAAQHSAELDVVRLREELAGCRAQLDGLDRDLRRAQNDVSRLERAKSEAERNVAEERDAARRAQHTLREWQAREEGRQEGRELELIRRYNDGHDDGFEDGRNEGFETGHAEGFEEGREEGFAEGRQEGYNAGRLAGFEEGKNVGWSEGFSEGLERGRKEERDNALRAFDKFVAAEFENKSVSDYSDDRTQDWVNTVRRNGTHSLESPPKDSPYQNEPLPDDSTITGPQPPPRRDLPPMPGSQVFVNMASESESFRRTLERDSEQSATRARSPSIRSQKIERTTSPIPAWLHRRPNTTGQGSRAMSPLPPLPSHH